MNHCKEIAVLVSESQDRELRRFERLKLRFHILLCPNCKRYSDSIESLRAMMDHYAEIGRIDDTSTKKNDDPKA